MLFCLPCGPDARAVLDRTVSTQAQGTALYNMDPTSYIQDWIGATGTDVLVNALAESDLSPMAVVEELDGKVAERWTLRRRSWPTAW